jgi:glycosyltransferase involved in cell wall biosynthesis
MRICVTGLRGLPNVMGGIESHCEELLPRVISIDPTVAIRILARKPYVPAAPSVFKGVEIVPLSSTRRQSLEAIVSTFLGVIHARRRNWRLVHIHAIGPGLLAPLARLLGLRVVVTHHGADYDRAKWSGFAKAMLRLGEWAAIKTAHQIIVVSPSLAASLGERFPAARQKIHYVPNGAPGLQGSGEDGQALLASLGLAGRKYILAVGRLVPEKGFDYLIRAFRESASDHVLLIAGDADHQSEFSKNLLAEADDRVRFLGRQPRSVLRTLYEGTALFVLPSFHEGLPISALEAGYCGAPMLLSDISANRDIGLAAENYFPVGDTAALATRLSGAFTDFAVNSHEVRARFDWDVIARQTLEIYKRADRDEPAGQSPG